VPLKVTTTEQIRKYLEILVSSGLYGRNPAEAAERLLERGIESLIERKRIEALNRTEREE